MFLEDARVKCNSYCGLGNKNLLVMECNFLKLCVNMVGNAVNVRNLRV